MASRSCLGPICWLLIFTTRWSLTASLGKTIKTVRLPGGFMEIVQEEACSDSLFRLTCRSLRAFVFVLEAEYRSDDTRACGYDLAKVRGNFERARGVALRKNGRMTLPRDGTKKVVLRGNYLDDEDQDDEDTTRIDLRNSFNRRCSGHHHCRVSLAENHPGAASWNPATLRLKYACIPEAAVWRYCNAEVRVQKGEGGYIKSPGYPLYYPGEYSCGWTFETIPGQRVALVFHDFSIRGREPNGRCVDIVRIRENGRTLFESCGTSVGISIVSSSNRVTLNLISASRLYPARGFLLQYKAIGCPEVAAPNGSYVSKDRPDSRTFKCRDASWLFPDTRENTRTLECIEGRWNESIEHLPNCSASSALIIKTETENNHISSLSGDNISGGHTGVRIGRGEDAVADVTGRVMDSAQPAMIKQADYVVDVVLPSILIALLFVGNAVIVYIIFQYRKRKAPAVVQGEEISLNSPAGLPQV